MHIRENVDDYRWKVEERQWIDITAWVKDRNGGLMTLMMCINSHTLRLHVRFILIYNIVCSVVSIDGSCWHHLWEDRHKPIKFIHLFTSDHTQIYRFSPLHFHHYYAPLAAKVNKCQKIDFLPTSQCLEKNHISELKRLVLPIIPDRGPKMCFDPQNQLTKSEAGDYATPRCTYYSGDRVTKIKTHFHFSAPDPGLWGEIAACYLNIVTTVALCRP